MRDINRIDRILAEIGEVWKDYPDLRFTQLIVNVMSAKGSDLYYMEDERFVKVLKEYYGDKEEE